MLFRSQEHRGLVAALVGLDVCFAQDATLRMMARNYRLLAGGAGQAGSMSWGVFLTMSCVLSRYLVVGAGCKEPAMHPHA